jgi:hypothetical protein
MSKDVLIEKKIIDKISFKCSESSVGSVGVTIRFYDDGSKEIECDHYAGAYMCDPDLHLNGFCSFGHRHKKDIEKYIEEHKND